MNIARCLAVALCIAAGAAAAQGKTCTPAESQATDKALDRVVNWDLMYKTFKEFGHCQTVMNEDLFTDALMRLAVEWKHVDQFAKHYQGDPQFKSFVVKHMKSLTAKEDVKSLYSRAKASCPPKLDAFCADLSEVAKEASR
ncbi:MAG TPA: hypothetical protein VEC19_18245 [Usitatibacter sp.]|nr:hypothetical protein [Usitatibacter sp.]